MLTWSAGARGVMIPLFSIAELLLLERREGVELNETCGERASAELSRQPLQSKVRTC